MATRFFTDSQPAQPALLRRTDSGVDERFRDGAWVPTKSIIDFEFGEDDFVTEVTAAEARKVAPAAFT